MHSTFTSLWALEEHHEVPRRNGGSMNQDDRYWEPPGADIVSELEAIHVEIDYEVIRFGPRSWGIRGHIAYDGDVLAAVFPNESQAWVAISTLRPTPHAHSGNAVQP